MGIELKDFQVMPIRVEISFGDIGENFTFTVQFHRLTRTFFTGLHVLFHFFASMDKSMNSRVGEKLCISQS